MTNVISLIASGTKASHTGDTAETVLATYTLLANVLPSNGALRITALFSRNSSGAASTPTNIRFGGLTGTAYNSGTLGTTLGTDQFVCMIYADGATNSQKGSGNLSSLTGGGGPMVTSSLDTTSPQDIVFTGKCNNAGDTINIESYTIELLS